MSALKILKIEESQEPQLIQAVKTVLTESQSHKADYIERLWSWNYKNLPTGQCDVIAAIEDNKILGYVHIVYVHAKVHQENCIAAILQDGGVLAEARGRGLWRKITLHAVEVIESSEVRLIYAYPNVKAIHTWRKYNKFQKVFDYQTYILPLDGPAIVKSKINIPILGTLAGVTLQSINNLRLSSKKDIELVSIEYNEIKPNTANLFNEYSAQYNIHVIRGKAFLDWRYFHKPIGEHFALTYKKNEEVLASAIIKIDKMLDVDSFIVMDFAYREGYQNKMGVLMRYLKEKQNQITDKKIGLIFAAFWNKQFLSKKTYGFIKVPDKLNPRIMPFLTKNIGGVKELFDADQWHTTLGEWDVL